MSALKRISNQLQIAFEGRPAWHGFSVLQLIEDITAAQAATRPKVGSHSIWEIVLHIGIWEEEIRKCLEGEKFRWISDDEDWLQIHDTSEEAWRKTSESLKEGHTHLLETISRFDANKLDSIVPSESDVSTPWSNTSFQSLLIGIIEHAAYHAGQIAILKKG